MSYSKLFDTLTCNVEGEPVHSLENSNVNKVLLGSLSTTQKDIVIGMLSTILLKRDEDLRSALYDMVALLNETKSKAFSVTEPYCLSHNAYNLPVVTHELISKSIAIILSSGMRERSAVGVHANDLFYVHALPDASMECTSKKNDLVTNWTQFYLRREDEFELDLYDSNLTERLHHTNRKINNGEYQVIHKGKARFEGFE